MKKILARCKSVRFQYGLSVYLKKNVVKTSKVQGNSALLPSPCPFGMVRGADRTRTQSFLLKIVRAPGTAVRLFADMSIQNWISLARASAPPVIWIP